MNSIGRLFSFNGRASRTEWWVVFISSVVIVYLSLALLSVGLSDLFNITTQRQDWRLVFTLLLIWPILAVGARRLHDRGRPGWLTLVQLIPVIGSIWAIFFLGLMPGQGASNEYGRPTGGGPQSVR